MYTRNTLELHLRRVVVDLPNELLITGSRALVVSLVAPRPTIAGRSHNRMIMLRDGQLDLSAAPFHRSIVFKETVQGPFGIRVALSDRGEPKQIEIWLRDLADYALRATGSYFSADLPTFLRTFAQRPFALAGGEVSRSQQPIQSFASGGTTISTSAKAKSTEITIPLLIETETMLPVTAAGPRKSSRPGARRATPKSSITLTKGTPVGEVTVEVKVV